MERQRREGVSDELVLRPMNEPSQITHKLKVLHEMCLFEGRFQRHDNKHMIRLDRRADNMGGDQLHIRRCDGQQWAYRFNGSRSEPNKYTVPATNAVKDIVSSVFNVDRSLIEEVRVVDADDERILVEIYFV
ncbi:MAG TPA: hypothetical protein PLO37_06505 [Candidatus Hydrogenedentes bacterium]|nr:hypothetical protein [Candidatus Hydrogenedentota bacterium]HPG66482.1 hypothetical protein [Candidatus Hydrogenedentota bacterium]